MRHYPRAILHHDIIHRTGSLSLDLTDLPSRPDPVHVALVPNSRQFGPVLIHLGKPLWIVTNRTKDGIECWIVDVVRPHRPPDRLHQHHAPGALRHLVLVDHHLILPGEDNDHFDRLATHIVLQNDFRGLSVKFRPETHLRCRLVELCHRLKTLCALLPQPLRDLGKIFF